MLQELLSRKDYFFTLASQHLLIAFFTMLFVTAFGIGIGMWVFYAPKARKIVMLLVNFLYTIPSIAMFGLLIPLVGIGIKNALIVLVLYGLLPIVHNTFSGMREVPSHVIEAAKGLGSNQLDLWKKIYFPLALPSILSGLRVTTVMVISLTGLAALIGAGGLGQAIFRGLNTMNTPLIVTGSLSVSLFAICGDLFIRFFEKQHALQRLISGNATRQQKLFVALPTLFLCFLLLSAYMYLNPLKDKSKNAITVASKPTSEQFILGEIIAQLIERDSSLTVYRQFGIGGGTTNIHPAMVSGNLDIYVEYTGTAWMNVLQKKSGKDIDFHSLNTLYQQQFQLQWMGLLGLNNTYALAIPEKIAQQKNIRTYSELAAQSAAFSLGGEFDFFERPDAYKGLLKHYPFHFFKLHEMDINLRYKALQDGQVNAIDAFSTDAQIHALHLRVLEDDKHFFPDYKAGIVIRQATLSRYPQLRPILDKLTGKISTQQMRAMNYAVEIRHQTPREVASQFLKTLP